MKLIGQTIRLFVIESLKNLKEVELSNWSGKAYIGERKHMQVIQNIDALANSTGVYFLLSNKTDETKLYIGEADDVAHRIKQHHQCKDKDWWESFIIFISKDLNLTKAHACYLEKELYCLAKENLTTISMVNGTSPPGSNLPISDIADMDVFLKNIIFVLNNLGIIDFAKTPEEEIKPDENKNIFYITLANSELQSKLVIEAEGYKLLKGSRLEFEARKSLKTHNYNNLRNKLIEEKVLIISEDGYLTAIQDIYFKSPSAAGAVVLGRTSNGRKDWKLQNGKTLDEFEAESV